MTRMTLPAEFFPCAGKAWKQCAQNFSFNKEASAKNKSLLGIKSKLREFLDFLESTIINGTGKAGKEVSGR